MTPAQERKIKAEYGTLSGFRKAKRAELRELQKSFDEFRNLADLLPTRAFHRTDIIRSNLTALKDELSVKKFGA